MVTLVMRLLTHDDDMLRVSLLLASAGDMEEL